MEARELVDRPGGDEGLVADADLSRTPVGKVVDARTAAREKRGLVRLAVGDDAERSRAALVAEVAGIFGVRRPERDEAADIGERPARIGVAAERHLKVGDRLAGEDHGEPSTPRFIEDEKDAPLIDADAEEESLYYGLVLGAKYFLHRSDTQLLALEYRNQMRAYAEDQDLSYTDNVFSALGRQPFLEWADIEVRASLGEAVSDGEGHLRTTRTVAPAFLFHFSPALQARLWGDWTDADYYQSDLPAEQDRDGVITRAGIVFGIDLGEGWSVAPHLGLANYEADGDDYDHRDWVLGLALTTAPYVGCVFSPSISYTRAVYDNEQSVVGFAEKRDDRIWRYAVTVSVRELEKLISYAPSVTLAFLDHGSNLDAYDYERWEPRIEMTLIAMSF